MAGTDKTYTNSFEDYKEFKDWANNQTLTFFDGHKECVGDWVWEYEEKDFSNGEIPIMNTPTWLDIYLIQNCKVNFVLDRLKSVYSDEYYKKFQTVDLTAYPPSDYKQNRKIKIKADKNCKFPFKKRMFKKGIDGEKWFLQSEDKFWYNDETKRWVNFEAYYPNNTNIAFISSTKALVRHLRKQYLPKGVSFVFSGKYDGERYIATIC